MHILHRNSRAFTLVEVMVAIVIIMVGLLGLIQAVGVTAVQNLSHQLREEAVLVGESQMADLHRRPFAMASTAFAPRFVTSGIRGTSGGYSVTRQRIDRASETVDQDNITTSELSVQINWTIKGSPYRHEVRTLRVYRDGI